MIDERRMRMIALEDRAWAAAREHYADFERISSEGAQTEEDQSLSRMAAALICGRLCMMAVEARAEEQA